MCQRSQFSLQIDNTLPTPLAVMAALALEGKTVITTKPYHLDYAEQPHSLPERCTQPPTALLPECAVSPNHQTFTMQQQVKGQLV